MFIVAGQDGARSSSADGKVWSKVAEGKEGETYPLRRRR